MLNQHNRGNGGRLIRWQALTRPVKIAGRIVPAGAQIDSIRYVPPGWERWGEVVAEISQLIIVLIIGLIIGIKGGYNRVLRVL